MLDSCLYNRAASSAGLWFLSMQPICLGLFSRSVVPVCAAELPLQPVCGSCLCDRTAFSAGLWFLSVQPNCLFSRSVVPVYATQLPRPLQPVCGTPSRNTTIAPSSLELAEGHCSRHACLPSLRHGQPSATECKTRQTRCQIPSSGLRQPSLEEGAGKRCSECEGLSFWHFLV